MRIALMPLYMLIMVLIRRNVTTAIMISSMRIALIPLYTLIMVLIRRNVTTATMKKE